MKKKLNCLKKEKKRHIIQKRYKDRKKEKNNY